MANIKHKMIHLNIQAKPLSINLAWQGRRFKSNLYKDFEKEVFYQLPKVKVLGEVSIKYWFYIKHYGKTDVSNLVKCVEDIIVKAGIIEDDRKVVLFSAQKLKTKAQEFIEIEIEQI